MVAAAWSGDQVSTLTGPPGTVWELVDARADCKTLHPPSGVTGLSSQAAQWSRICLPMQETQETQGRSLGREEPLEWEMATHPSVPTQGALCPHCLSPFPKQGDRLAASVPRTADPEQVLPGRGDLRGSADSSDRQMGVQTALLLASSQWRLGTLRGTLQGPERPPPRQRTQPPNKPRLEPRSSNGLRTPEFLPGYLKVRTRCLTQRRLSPFPRLLLSRACGGPSWGLGRQQRRPWEPSFSGSR